MNKIGICSELKTYPCASQKALNLYLDGDKSRVIDIDDADSLSRTFPKFLRSERHVANLEPGDILYIPALWFHNMTALDFGMAVNVFWKNLDPRYDHSRKAYLALSFPLDLYKFTHAYVVSMER